MCNRSKIRNSLLPIGRQTFSHFQESRASSCVIVTCEDKCYNPKCPVFLLLPPAFIAERNAMCHGISLWPAALVVSFPNFSHTPSLLAGRLEWGKRKDCDAVQTLLSNR